MIKEDLSAKCNLLKWDLSHSTLAKIESQVRRITDEEVALLAKALKVEMYVLDKNTYKILVTNLMQAGVLQSIY